MYAGYKVGGTEASFTAEAPDSMYGAYPYTSWNGATGCIVLPDGWESSYYCTVCQQTKTEAIPAAAPAVPDKDDTDAPDTNTPDADTNPETGDAGIALLAAAVVLSVTGAALVLKKKLLVK